MQQKNKQNRLYKLVFRNFVILDIVKNLTIIPKKIFSALRLKTTNRIYNLKYIYSGWAAWVEAQDYRI